MHLAVQTIFASPGLSGLVEVSWTDAKSPHPLNQAELFDVGDLDAVVEHAARMNLTPNRNVYVSAGIRRDGTSQHARASDADVISCVACWADFDGAGALQAAVATVERLGLRPNLITFTGKEPHLRGQMWWVFDEPCADLGLHRRLQMALARKLGGDPTVVNPSRVMRLVGSVAWPLKAGRTLEMTGILEGETRVAPYVLEELQSVLERDGALDFTTRPTAKVLDFTPGALDLNQATPTYDYDSLVAGAAKPGEWHKHALLATAHLLGRGTPSDVVVDLLTTSLRQPGYGSIQTRQELMVMVDGAIKRGLHHERPTEFAPKIDKKIDEQPLASPFLTIAQLMDLPPVEWMIDGYLPTVGMSAIFAPPGAFKSFLALDIAMSVAYGLPWHGLDTKQRRVLYVVAEGKWGFGRRIRVWQQHRAEAQDTDQFHLLPVPVNFLEPECVDRLIEAIDVHLHGVGLVVIDTVARNFGPGDENSTKDMNAYVAGSGKLIDRGAHVLHVHHTGKDGSKGERGSSAFRGALDTAISVDREQGSDVATIYVRKQKDAAEAKPMRLSFPVAEGSHPVTGEVFTSRIPTVAGNQNVSVRASQMAVSGISKMQVEIMRVIASGITSTSLIAAEMDCDKSNISRSLRALKTRGLVIQDENHFWRLTDHQTDHQENEENQDD